LIKKGCNNKRWCIKCKAWLG